MYFNFRHLKKIGLKYTYKYCNYLLFRSCKLYMAKTFSTIKHNPVFDSTLIVLKSDKAVSRV